MIFGQVIPGYQWWGGGGTRYEKTLFLGIFELLQHIPPPT